MIYDLMREAKEFITDALNTNFGIQAIPVLPPPQPVVQPVVQPPQPQSTPVKKEPRKEEKKPPKEEKKEEKQPEEGVIDEKKIENYANMRDPEMAK